MAGRPVAFTSSRCALACTVGGEPVLLDQRIDDGLLRVADDGGGPRGQGPGRSARAGLRGKELGAKKWSRRGNGKARAA